MKKKIETEKWNRNKHFEWFKNFSNSCYGIDKKIDITKLVKYTKENDKSFFICMLYIVVESLNSIDQMRIRYEDGDVFIYDEINPSYTIMTKSGEYENVRQHNEKDFNKFYELTSKNIEEAKNQDRLTEKKYNPENCYNEYYITSLPWISVNSFSHPIPDDKSNACIPRICWDKYRKIEENYEITLNITVSHMFVDGYPLAQAFIKIQELIDNIDNIMK